MNSVNIVGKLIDDPIKSTSSNGLSIMRFKLAVDKTNKTDNTAYDVFEVTVFRELADLKLDIGQIVGVTGKLVSNNYEKEGKNYYNCSIVGNYLSVLGC